MIINNQRGSILIMALFIMLIIASLASLMLSRSTSSLKLTRNLLEKSETSLLSGKVLGWATSVLLRNKLQRLDGNILDAMPMSYLNNDLQDYTLAGELQDAQSFFNINSLSGAYDYAIVFINLIKLVCPDVENPGKLTRNIKTWVSEYGMGSGQYDEKYRLKPYYPAHRMIVDIHSLQLIEGVTPQIFNALSPYIVALPVVSQINVNTASQTLLRALMPGLTTAEADAIIERRKTQAFNAVSDFANNAIVLPHHFANQVTVSTTSDFFLLNSSVRSAQRLYTTQWLLRRFKNSDQQQVAVLWQK